MSAALLRSQRHALLNTISANNAVRVDRVGRMILDGLTARMERYVRQIDREIERGAHDAGWYGPNGWQATIEDLIKSSKLHREQSTPVSRKAAA